MNYRRALNPTKEIRSVPNEPTLFSPSQLRRGVEQRSAVTCTGHFAKLLRTLGKPHTLEIVYGLSIRSPMRFSEIQRQLKIQPKTLTSRLQELVSMGLLERTVYNEIPPRVDYALTERGKNLGVKVNSLREVLESHACPPG